MKTKWLGWIALLGFAGCHQGQPLSGTYVAKDTQGVALLQLTENQNQQLMGSLTFVNLENDGSLDRKVLSITEGTTDGTSLTITIRSNAAFGQSGNISGTVSGGGIDLTMGTTIHFSPSSTEEFESAAQGFAKEGGTKQRLAVAAKTLADDIANVNQLSTDLSAFLMRRATHLIRPGEVHDKEKKILEAAHQEAELVAQLEARHMDFQAGQARFRIGQLDFRMGQIRFEVDQILGDGKQTRQDFDQRIASSPCSFPGRLEACKGLAVEEQQYGTVKEDMLRISAQLTSDLQQSEAEMAQIKKESGS